MCRRRGLLVDLEIEIDKEEPGNNSERKKVGWTLCGAIANNCNNCDESKQTLTDQPTDRPAGVNLMKKFQCSSLLSSIGANSNWALQEMNLFAGCLQLTGKKC